MGMGPRPSEGWAVPLVILCPAASLCPRALQGPPACIPMPAGSLSWLHVPTLSMGLHHPLHCAPGLAESPSWLRVPLPPGSPPWLPVPILPAVSILAACPCTILSSLYWLRGPTLAVDACTSSVPMQAVRPCTGWVPVPAASPGGHGSHFAAPGERDHPCKQQVLSLCEPGLMATHELLGRERGRHCLHQRLDAQGLKKLARCPQSSGCLIWLYLFLPSYC